MAKSADAFRTISEVSEWLETPAHVLRFWESKFSQVKPVKRAGGRRYYRPSDMELLGGIKKLLHDDGMTIKGVQKLLRERGIAHVAELSVNRVSGADEEARASTPADNVPTGDVEEPATIEQSDFGFTAAPRQIAEEHPATGEPADAPLVEATASDEAEATQDTPELPEPPQRFHAPDPETSIVVPFRHEDRDGSPDEEAVETGPAPIRADVPADPGDDTLDVAPGLLTLAARRTAPLGPEAAELLVQLGQSVRSGTRT